MTRAEKFSQIEADVNAALAAAAKHKDQFPNDPINWGDLRCVDIRLLTGVKRTPPKWLVTVSEAAPDCPKLHQFIRESLQSKWRWVEVRTEW
jgi:hypothetical protein